MGRGLVMRGLGETEVVRSGRAKLTELTKQRRRAILATIATVAALASMSEAQAQCVVANSNAVFIGSGAAGFKPFSIGGFTGAGSAAITCRPSIPSIRRS
jgi:hypothetical protein